jgi:hypothetical protein
MDRYKFNIDEFTEKISTPKMYKLASVEDRVTKIGCGLVRFRYEDGKTGLWKIVKDENDGTEYIAAMYDEEPDSLVSNSWSIEKDKFNKTATIFYENVPVTNIVFAEIGIPEIEVHSFLKNLPERLKNNKKVVQAMLNSVNKEYKEELIKKFPEML